ncbi:P-loop NTPase family protein [Sphingomonas glaciei]|uniref:CobQ/CobB/MinD/ParA nucleotide binding domain-containing protein n=1 Tax=Sphingomonas glaciei TaxID=2938948 RepID=A0ABY5MRI9_9SPHN|nr:hypothetical protein [Sphingomonas glaciei]UUR06743.1 hypothetical protein M1K48_07175 [Sphingomonas glaciei]
MVNDPQAPAGTICAKETSSKLPLTVYAITTVKGGAGKTELAECLEATHTLSGHRTTLVDVDDGNRGLVRRVGATNVLKVEWCTSVLAAPDWVARHSANTDTMIFDLGAGIDSSDLPVMAFLETAWRMLADRGARIIICAVVSTNAPTSNFVERLERRFGALGEVVVVCNNQDGSEAYPAEIAALTQQKIHLARLQSGIQAVRLSRRERLSSVIRTPHTGHFMACALMAKRILEVANQAFFKSLPITQGLEELKRLAQEAPKQFHYAIDRRSHATDEIIGQNAILAVAEIALRRRGLIDDDILAAAKNYRLQHDRYIELTRAAPK